MPDSEYPVYYRIYLLHTGKLGVICLQSFDEDDYNEDKYVKDGDGHNMRWDDEEEARQYLNEHFKVEYIHQDDIRHETVINKMRKETYDA